MRLTRLATATVTAAVLAFGLAACGSSDDTANEPEATVATEAAEVEQEATEEAAPEETAAQDTTVGGDYCAVAEQAFADFDQTALSSGDPTALREAAEGFRQVGGATEGEVRDAWVNYAALMDASADAVEDPSAAAAVMEQMENMQTWITTITESLTACA